MNVPVSTAPDVLVDIGEKAVDYVNARAARVAARRERNRAAGEFADTHGGDARYSDDSAHPKGFSNEYLAATHELHRAYEAAVSAERSARQRLYAAVKKRAALARVGGGK